MNAVDGVRVFLSQAGALDCALITGGGVTGASFGVSLNISGQPHVHEGWVYDFGDLRRALRRALTDGPDHRLVLPSDIRPHAVPDGLQVRFPWGAEEAEYCCPPGALSRLTGAASEETLRQHLENLTRMQIPQEMAGGLDLELQHEKDASSSFFGYTHGLRYHAGACQHLLHGHRGRLGAWVDGCVAPELAQRLSAEMDGVHAANAACVVSVKTEPNRRQNQHPRIVIAYRASTGNFRLDLPGAAVLVLDGEPTAENLALYLARRGRELIGTKARVRVETWEGLGKGASAEAG